MIGGWIDFLGRLLGWRAVVVVAPTEEGLEFTLPERRSHFTLSSSLDHFTLPENRMHFTLAEEDEG